MPFRVMWSSCIGVAQSLEEMRDLIPFMSYRPASYRLNNAIVVSFVLHKPCNEGLMQVH